MKSYKNFLWGIALLVSCEMTAPISPECADLRLEQRGNQWVCWWLPTIDPAHSNARLYCNGEPVQNMCRRDEELNLSTTGRWSFFVEAGHEVCIDYDSEVTANDCECTSKAE